MSKKRIMIKLSGEALSGKSGIGIVITSYSIHYTKLYESAFKWTDCRKERGFTIFRQRSTSSECFETRDPPRAGNGVLSCQIFCSQA